jgi:hypothetical protein
LLIGILKIKVAPFPSALFAAHIFPPCLSTMFLEIYKPKPVPFSDFVVNFENNLGSISESIPTPVSFTVIITSLPFLSVEIEM